MIEEELVEAQNYWSVHRFMLLVIMAIVTAGVLVSISLGLYVSSGTLQLDLSRPGYQSVSSQTDNSSNQVENYPETGNLDSTALNNFQNLYNSQSDKAKAIDAFGGDPLDPTSIGLLQTN